jgi:hypothetical protein
MNHGSKTNDPDLGYHVNVQTTIGFGIFAHSAFECSPQIVPANWLQIDTPYRDMTLPTSHPVQRESWISRSVWGTDKEKIATCGGRQC